MQQSLDEISLWATKWKMVLAVDKTQSITFKQKNKKKFPKMKLQLLGSNLNEIKQVKYLGLIMDSNLTYKQHIYYVFAKANRKLGYLTYLCSYKGIRPSLSAYYILYKTIIRPTLEYACSFWNGAADVHKSKLDKIQRLAMCRILGVMKNTAYDTINVLTQVPPLELRRRQEEVNLYHCCIRLSIKFPDHNLTQAYNLWRRNCDFENKNQEYISWTGKLSTLSRAFIHAAEVNIPNVSPDTEPFQNKPPTQIVRIPHPTKSPFPKVLQPTAEDILASLTSDCVIIYSDGSCKPNPGIGGAGLVVYDPSLLEPLELEFPIQGITTNIASEIEGLKQAITYVHNNYTNHTNRTIILSDCKFAINAIFNRFNSECYTSEIRECQNLLNSLGPEDVPEIYWIKGHSKILGNERVYVVAK